MKKKLEISYDQTGRTFEESNSYGAREFPKSWLVVNEAMVDVATYKGLQTHDAAVKELLSESCFKILLKLRNAGFNV